MAGNKQGEIFNEALKNQIIEGTQNKEEEKQTAVEAVKNRLKDFKDGIKSQLPPKTVEQSLMDQLKKGFNEEVNKEVKSPTTDVVAIETPAANEIKIDLRYGVSATDIVTAIDALRVSKPDLVNAIIPLFKLGDAKGVQKELGMRDDVTLPLSQQADGKFGRKSLENLRAGGITANNVLKMNEKNMLKDSVVALWATYIINLGNRSFKETYGDKKVDGFGATKIDDYTQEDINKIDRVIKAILDGKEGIDKHQPDAIVIDVFKTNRQDILRQLKNIPATLEYRIDTKDQQTGKINHRFFKKDGSVMLEPSHVAYKWAIENNDVKVGKLSLKAYKEGGTVPKKLQAAPRGETEAEKNQRIIDTFNKNRSE